MTREIFRIKYIKNDETITDFSMNFRKWRRLHRKGGGSPYVIELTPPTIDMRNRIEITLRSEEADTMIEESRRKGERKKMNEKVKEVQEYLKRKGLKVAETTIVDMAIDLARRLGAGDWTFACEAKMRKEIEEREKEEEMEKK